MGQTVVPCKFCQISVDLGDKIAELAVLELTNKNPVVKFVLENPAAKVVPLIEFKASQEFDSKSSDILWTMIFDIAEFWVPLIGPDSAMVNILLYKAILRKLLEEFTREELNTFEVDM